jgi:hypothetical protein
MARRPHRPTFGYRATTAWFSCARPSGSAPMAEYLRQRNPPFSVHTTLGWKIVKTLYAPVQYVLVPRTLTTCLMAWRRRPSANCAQARPTEAELSPTRLPPEQRHFGTRNRDAARGDRMVRSPRERSRADTTPGPASVSTRQLVRHKSASDGESGRSLSPSRVRTTERAR